jgi:hypothetical protein
MGAMKLTVPSHIVLANVPNGWPAIPQFVAAQDDDGNDLPPEMVWEVERVGDTQPFNGSFKMRDYRVEDRLMIWVRLAKFPAQAQASYIVFAQAPRRDPAKTRLNRFLKALKQLDIVAKEWRIIEGTTYWYSAELDADTGARPDRVRSKWPDSWYPITGYTGTFPNLVPVYDTAHPIIGSIFAL